MSGSPDGGPLVLLEHQVRGIEELRRRERMLLADEPGLGKSAQLLGAAIEPVLILAPAMVLDSGTWDDEIEKWAPGIDATQMSYSKMCVRNPKGVVRRNGNGDPIVHLKPELRRKWGTVIGDESHYMKGRQTSWTAAFKKLTDPRSVNAPEKVDLATGTPIPNWAHEAFTTLQFLNPHDARSGGRFGSYWRWAKDWFDVSATQWAPMAVGDLREDTTWAEFYAANWGDSMLLRLRKDCLDLPPLIGPIQWMVKMTPAQKRAYKELKRDFITWLGSGAEVAAWSSAGQMVKLFKCATGLEVLDPREKGSGKLDALRTILSDRPFPTLVVAHFRDSVAACARVVEELGMTVLTVGGGVGRAARKDAIRSFQSGNLDVLCASVETIAEGMTLHQGGADQVIRVERSARPSKNEQVLRRLHRMGVEKPITAIDLVTEGTLDEAMLAMLAEKTDQQMHALGLHDIQRLLA